MKDHYDADIKETPEGAAAKGYERVALQATIKGAEPVNLGAADQMTDTPVHTQGDAPDCLLQSLARTTAPSTPVSSTGSNRPRSSAKPTG